MASGPVKSNQDIEALRERHKKLEHKKVAAETSLKSANEQLELLKKQALEQFGTDDLEQLKLKLAAMKEENERKRAEYQKHLDQIEAGLSEVERQYEQSRVLA